VDLAVVATVFGLIFIGELPDKTAVASLVLGARYPPLLVWAGVSAAFLIHVIIACVAGGFVAALPHKPVELVTAALFLIGAVILWRSNAPDSMEEGEKEAESIQGDKTPWQVIGASFTVVLVAEFGDLTQILTATLAAKYHDPLSVAVGATLALWAVAGIAVTSGRSLLKVVPLHRVQQLAAVALTILAVYSLYTAFS
jgi:putative Ca2+/H+ antiporter (TMEM165/GDT1 family)